jgi:ketosteroid isomerase-like protein
MMNRMTEGKYIKGRTRIGVGLGTLLYFVLFIASCIGSKQSDQTTDSADEKQAIEKTLTGIVEAANAGDIEAVMAYFAEDAVAMPTDEMPVFGTKLIRPRIQTLFDQSRVTIFLTSEETAVSGDFAFARGYIGGKIWPKSAAPDRLIDDNEYLMLLEKDSGGAWKIARLMWHPMFPKGPAFYN